MGISGEGFDFCMGVMSCRGRSERVCGTPGTDLTADAGVDLTVAGRGSLLGVTGVVNKDTIPIFFSVELACVGGVVLADEGKSDSVGFSWRGLGLKVSVTGFA